MLQQILFAYLLSVVGVLNFIFPALNVSQVFVLLNLQSANSLGVPRLTQNCLNKTLLIHGYCRQPMHYPSGLSDRCWTCTYISQLHQMETCSQNGHQHTARTEMKDFRNLYGRMSLMATIPIPELSTLTLTSLMCVCSLLTSRIWAFTIAA